jgi:hypothetical protein
METVLVNRAAWTDAPEVPDRWVIANAPRPLTGQLTWAGEFRHGTFYAAAPTVPDGSFGWAADDAWLVEFITNDEISRRVFAHLAKHNVWAPEDLGMTLAEVAETMQLPWHEG